MRKIFVTGEIQTERRGRQIVVITKENHNGRLGAFIYDVYSNEFTVLTGTSIVYSPIVRLYIGVNVDTASEICGRVNKAEIKPNLKEIDKLVVVPYFYSKMKQESQEFVSAVLSKLTDKALIQEVLANME